MRRIAIMLLVLLVSCGYTNTAGLTKASAANESPSVSNGSDFASDLGFQNVIVPSGDTQVMFAAEGDKPDEYAYCIYRLNYNADRHSMFWLQWNTVHVHEWPDFWLGFANWSSHKWEWQLIKAERSVEGYYVPWEHEGIESKYLLPNGNYLVIVAMTNTNLYYLQSLGCKSK